MSASQDDLIKRAVNGNREALAALLVRHGPQVRRLLRGKIPARWQSVLSDDDVMQQTYAEAVANIAQFTSNTEDAFAAWAATIARRNLLDAIRMLEAEKRGGGRRPICLESLQDSYFALFDSLLSRPQSTPSRRVAKAEAESALRRALACLPEVQARVVLLYDLQGRSVQEVAEALERSPGAVFMLRARAHRRLVEILGTPSNFLSDSP